MRREKFFALLFSFVLLAQLVSALSVYSGGSSPRSCPVIVQDSAGSNFNVYTTSGRSTGLSGTVSSTGYGSFQFTASQPPNNYIVRANGQSRTVQLSSSASCNYCFIGNRPYSNGDVNPSNANQYCDVAHPFEWQTRHVHHITLAPVSKQLVYGDEQLFLASGFDANGHLVYYPVSWELEGGNIGRIISSSGDSMLAGATVRAERAGTAYLVASSDGVEARARITVSYGALSRIDLQATDDEVLSGASVQITATGYDADGNAFPINPAWSVSSPSVGTINGAGRTVTFNGRTAGTASVTASQGSVGKSVSITVVPGNLNRVDLLSNGVSASDFDLEAGASKSFEARGFDANSNRIDARDLTYSWSSAVGDFNSDDAASVRFTAQDTVANGILSMRVSDERGNSLNRQLNVRVVHAPLSRIEVSGGDVSMRAGEQRNFSVAGFDRFDNSFAASASWAVAPADLGEFVGGSSGERVVFKARKAVEGTITASSGSLRDGVSVEVSPGPVDGVEIRSADGSVVPIIISLRAGETVDVVAVSLDAFGNDASSEADFEWSVDPSWFGSVDADGSEARFTASQNLSREEINAGILKVVDRSSGPLNIFDTVGIELSPGPLAEIIVYPVERVELRSGETQAFNASGFDEFRNSVGEINAEWSVSSELGDYPASTGSSYYFVATKAGVGTVSASVGAVSGVASVIVSPGQISVLNVSSGGAVVEGGFSLRAGSAKNFSVHAFDASGNEVVEGLGFGWTSSVGSFEVGDSADAVFVAQTRAPASGVIVVSVVDALGTRVNASFSVQVSPGVLSSIALEPSSAEPIKSGYSAAFNAIGKDEFGNNLTGVVFEWRVDPVEVGSLSGSDSIAVFTGSVVGNGSVIVSAVDSEGVAVSNSTSIQVVAGDPVRVDLLYESGAGLVSVPASIDVLVGDSKYFVARVFDLNGNVVPREQLSFGWAISRDELGVLSFDDKDDLSRNDNVTFVSSGRLTEVRDGSLNVSVASRLNASIVLSGSVGIHISPRPASEINFITPPTEAKYGAPVEFFAVAEDGSGNPAAEEVAWSSDGGSFNSSTGSRVNFTASRVGSVGVTAAAGSVSETVFVEVSAGEIAGVEIVSVDGEAIAEPLVLIAGEERELRARGVDAGGNEVIKGLSFVWSSVPELGAFNDSSSQQVAFAANEDLSSGVAGVVSVSVVGTSFSRNLTVQLVPADLETLEVFVDGESRESVGVVAGSSKQFEAKGFDVFGNEVSLESVEWSAEGVGSIDASGLLRVGERVANGFINVSGASGGVSKSSGVVVRVLASRAFNVSVQASSLSTFPEDNVSIVAIVSDSFGNVVEGAEVVFALVASPEPAGVLVGSSASGSTVSESSNADGEARVVLETSSSEGNSTVEVGLAGVEGASASVTVETFYTSGTVNGFILNNLGLPVEGASVVFADSPLQAQTDAAGFYEFRGVGIGSYILSASKANHSTVSVAVEVIGGRVSQVNFTLVQFGGVEGSVNGRSGGLEGARVGVYSNESGDLIALLLADNLGAFSKSDLLPGVYSLFASAENYFSSWLNGVSVESGIITHVGIINLNYNDSSVPSISFVEPTPAGESGVSGVIFINASGSDDVGISSIRLLANGLEFASCASALSCSADLDTNEYEDGLLGVVVEASDAAGNSNSSSRVFYVDRIAPFIEFSSLTPSDGLNVSGVFSITANASDETPLNLIISVNGSEVSSACVNSSSAEGLVVSCSSSVNSSIYGDGVLAFSAQANGVLSSSTVSRAINVNNTSPPVPATIVIVPASAIARAGEAVDFNASVFDSNGNLLEGVGVEWSAVGGTIDSSGLFNSTSVGEAVVFARAGNETDFVVANASVVVVAGAPASLNLAAESQSVVPGGQVTITASLFDAFGHRVAGSNVSFALASALSGASLSSDSIVTNEFGEAIVVLTASPAGRGGAHVVTASVGGLSANVSVQSNATIGALEGFVLSSDGSALYGVVQIVGTGLSVAADGFGRYLFEEVAPGVYTVTASYSGHLTQTISNVNVGLGSNVLNFELVKVGKVSGFVRGADGNAVEGVIVSIQPSTGRSEVIERFVSRVDGYYSLSLAPGVYNLSFSKEGFATQFVSNAVVVSGEEKFADAVVYRLGSFGGLVVDALTDEGISGAVITVFDSASGVAVSQTVSDAGGEFSVQLPAGVYDVEADTTSASENLGVQIVYRRAVAAGGSERIVFAFI